ncbi:hypothetical protein HYT23_05550 [Candidatus Pacearchaeota archaeon]|nr:hypothetical protein [Candidatus Pacearchaeota archaeon]
MTNILFLCKWNRFRSKIAEAIFNKLNKSKIQKAKSAGIFPGLPISKEIFDTCKKMGYSITKKVNGINYRLLMWSDIIIVIENSIPLSIFNEIIKNDKKRVIIWRIADPYTINKREATIKVIEKRVKSLIKKMKK